MTSAIAMGDAAAQAARQAAEEAARKAAAEAAAQANPEIAVDSDVQGFLNRLSSDGDTFAKLADADGTGEVSNQEFSALLSSSPEALTDHTGYVQDLQLRRTAPPAEEVVTQATTQQQLNRNQAALDANQAQLTEEWDAINKRLEKDPTDKALLEQEKALAARQQQQDEAQQAHDKVQDRMDRAWKKDDPAAESLQKIAGQSGEKLTKIAGTTPESDAILAATTGQTTNDVTSAVGALDTAGQVDGQAQTVGNADGWISGNDVAAAVAYPALTAGMATEELGYTAAIAQAQNDINSGDANRMAAGKQKMAQLGLHETADRQWGIKAAEFAQKAQNFQPTVNQPAQPQPAPAQAAEAPTAPAPAAEAPPAPDGAAASAPAPSATAETPPQPESAWVAAERSLRAAGQFDDIGGTGPGEAIALNKAVGTQESLAHATATQAAIDAYTNGDASWKTQLQAAGFEAPNGWENLTDPWSAYLKFGQTTEQTATEYAGKNRVAKTEFNWAESRAAEAANGSGWIDLLLSKGEATDPNGLGMTEDQFNAAASGDEWMTQDEYVAGRLSGAIAFPDHPERQNLSMVS